MLMGVLLVAVLASAVALFVLFPSAFAVIVVGFLALEGATLYFFDVVYALYLEIDFAQRVLKSKR